MLNNYNYVALVTHPNDTYKREYAFALFDTEDVKRGDMVLCDTKSGFVLGYVNTIIDREAFEEDFGKKNVSKEIICKVNPDLDSYYQRQEKEKRIVELKTKMNNLAKKQEKLLLYKQLAEISPEMKALYDEYMALDSEV